MSVNDSEKEFGNALRAAFQETVDEGVPPEFSKLIDQNLKKAFEDTVEEGVPDRFAELLAQLKTASGGRRS